MHRTAVPLFLVLGGCPAASEPCACDEGQGVVLCEAGDCSPCQCLGYATPTVDPTPVTPRFVDADASGGDGSESAPWATPDWAVLDADVAVGDVLVIFDASDTWPERLAIGRTDLGPNRVVLDGRHSQRTSSGWSDAGTSRATVPGILTGYDDVARSRITVRGFDVTGSRDKGIYWRMGDDIVIEDNLIHANKGTPALSLDYTSRTGHRSTSFVVRNNHIWGQTGEGIYIGGAEGEDLDAHHVVVIENNLIHDLNHPTSTRHDGINIKDRIRSVTVSRNVVFKTHWGIELASPSVVTGNLVFATQSNGLHITDAWGTGMSGMILEDDVILDGGEAGIYLNATHNTWNDVTLSRITVSGVVGAAVEAGGDGGITGTITDVVLADAKVGLDAWSPMSFALDDCTVSGVVLTGDRDFAQLAQGCVDAAPEFGDLTVPAGPDGRFFTEDDPWLSTRGGARLEGR